MADWSSMPFAEALAFFRQKLNLPTARWDDLLGAAHDRAFVVAGAMKADLLADLRAAVEKAIAEGTTLAQFRKDFNEIVWKHGWINWTGEGSKGGYNWRTQVIYDTNLFSSYSAGRYKQMKTVAHRRPYWRYRHSHASVTPRVEHLAWDGLILRHDDPWWDTHTPINAFGCKCYVETLSQREMDQQGLTVTPDDQIPYNSIDPKTGAPLGIGKGFGYQPGANDKTPLNDLIVNKLGRLDADIGAAMMDAMRQTLGQEMRQAYWRWLDEVLADPVGRRRVQVVGSLTPGVLSWLKTEKNINPVSAEIAVQDNLVIGRKAKRHQAAGNALTDNEWRKLPDMLEAPAQVLFDSRSGKLIYVYPAGSKSTKIAVEFDYRVGKTDKSNAVVSAFKVQEQDIQGMIKGRVWEVVK